MLTGLSVEEVNHLLYVCLACVVPMHFRISNMTKLEPAMYFQVRRSGAESKVQCSCHSTQEY